ncbi:hypothetical protein GH714_040822 [Hevea brasiliensis]|uniref:Uncharacterized protein n=1 Tax=Hevea brasiliensis TaxID=3981 RepID=A0A6A6MSM8_HEVBR|nr:hypothetical protein GH714_040822 [Hevea brasiliensis]
MRSLETRVHGLELALDEISYDLAVSSGRMTNSHRTTCCMLPGADFLSSKFWRKTESCYSTSRFSSTGTPSLAAIRHRAVKNGNTGTQNLESHRLQLQGGGGFIVNPLAEIHESSLMKGSIPRCARLSLWKMKVGDLSHIPTDETWCASYCADMLYKWYNLVGLSSVRYIVKKTTKMISHVGKAKITSMWDASNSLKLPNANNMMDAIPYRLPAEVIAHHALLQ